MTRTPPAIVLDGLVADIRATHPKAVAFTMPMKLVNSLNSREHHMAIHRRAKSQRAQATMAYRCHARGRNLKPPFVVVFTRIAPSNGMDSDGLAASCKHIRDGIADALGVKDGDTKRIKFAYRQERGKAREYAAVVQVYGT